jgi:hypothetical protein
MRKRALLLDAAARSVSLIVTAHELCRGSGARIIFDMLIPGTDHADPSVLVLRDAVRMPGVKDDIAREQPIIFIRHEHIFTDFSPADALLIQPAHARFEIIRHPAHTGYLFHVGEGCGQK